MNTAEMSGHIVSVGKREEHYEFAGFIECIQMIGVTSSVCFPLASYTKTSLVVLAECCASTCIILDPNALLVKSHGWMCANDTVPRNTVHYSGGVQIKNGSDGC